MVAEIFSQARLGSLAFVAWHIVLSDVRSSNTHPLDSSQYELFQTLNEDLWVQCEVMLED